MSRLRSLLAAAVAAGLVLTLVGCGGSGSKDSASSGGGGAATTTATVAGDAAHGKEIFAGTCSACHGQDAKGMPGLGKDLVASQFIAGLSDAQFVEFITKGRSTSDKLNTTGVEMPPKGGNPALTDKDLADVVAYIRSLRNGK